MEPEWGALEEVERQLINAFGRSSVMSASHSNTAPPRGLRTFQCEVVGPVTWIDSIWRDTRGRFSKLRQNWYISSGLFSMMTELPMCLASRCVSGPDDAFSCDATLRRFAQYTSSAVIPTTAAAAAPTLPRSVSSDAIALPSDDKSKTSPPTRDHSHGAGFSCVRIPTPAATSRIP